MRNLLTPICIVVLLLAACGPAKNINTSPTPSPGGPARAAANGLTDAERANFYHMAEGSELFPYSWMKALHTVDDKPFLDNPERFGLLSDPSNSDGLPIGFTKANRRGVPLGEMVGINCAACHVGELRYKDRAFRIDGTQNLVDLVAFETELFKDSEATVTSPEKLFAFLIRWWDQSHDSASAQPVTRAATVSAVPDQSAPPPGDATRRLLSHHKSLDDLRKEGELEKSLADEIAALVEKHKTTPPTKGAQLKAKTVKFVSAIQAKRVATKAPAKDGIFAASKSAGEREASVTGILNDVEEYIALLYSYAELLKGLAGVGVGGTPGGYGRVDAFGGARNLLFPKNAQPSTAPVCYPFLWGFRDTAFFHYAANTNSILERNIGQALGLGATYDHTFGTFATSVDIRNTNALEELAHKIKPPEWPAEIFGAIDAAKAARGKELYQQNCAGCHEQFQNVPPPPNVPPGSWVLKTFKLDEIGTDPNEAKNFGVPVTFGGQSMPLPQAIAKLVPMIEARYYKDFNISADEQTAWNHGRLPAEWSGPEVYSARPMAGVWATPPYLHNGSVLTLYDLLLPAAQRPKMLYVGTREYDPVHLGYVNQKDELRPFQIDTTGPGKGNSNAGHEYGTALTEAQKMDLLEFMKSLTQMPLPKD